MATIPSIAMIPSGYKANKVYSVLPTDGSGDLNFARTTTATRINSGGLIEEVAIGVPRLDYTDGSCPSLLLEPSSTNLITYSEDLSGMQVAFGGVISLDTSVINPTGNSGSYFIYDSDGGGVSRFRVSSPGFNIGDKLSYSLFVKSESNSTLELGGNYGGESCSFNVGTKSLISQGSAVDSYKIISISEEWTRYVVNTTFTNTFSGNPYPFFTTNATFSEKIYVWGHQLEQQSYATSYIKTAGTAITRTADTASKSGISSLIGQTEGTFFVDFKFESYGSIFGVNRSFQNMIQLGLTSSNILRFVIYNSGTSVQLDSTFNFTKNTNYKVAVTYKSGSFKMFINGSLDRTNTSPLSLNAPLEDLEISPDYFFNSTELKIKSLQVFKTALTDAELEKITSYSSFNEMALALNYKIQ